MAGRKFPGDFPFIHLDLFIKLTLTLNFVFRFHDHIISRDFHQTLTTYTYSWNLCSINENSIHIGFPLHFGIIVKFKEIISKIYCNFLLLACCSAITSESQKKIPSAVVQGHPGQSVLTSNQYLNKFWWIQFFFMAFSMFPTW